MYSAEGPESTRLSHSGRRLATAGSGQLATAAGRVDLAAVRRKRTLLGSRAAGRLRPEAAVRVRSTSTPKTPELLAYVAARHRLIRDHRRCGRICPRPALAENASCSDAISSP